MKTMNVAEMHAVNAGGVFGHVYTEQCRVCGTIIHKQWLWTYNDLTKALKKGAQKEKAHKNIFGSRHMSTISW